jgi:hypothetical protein
MTFKHEEFTMEKIQEHIEGYRKDVWVLGYKEENDKYLVQVFDAKDFFYKFYLFKNVL